MKYLPLNYQQGLTLVELLIATVLGMFVVLAVTSLAISSKSAQSAQNDAAIMRDTARFTLNNISHSVKQAGYVNFDQTGSSIQTENLTPGIAGFDAGSLKATTHGVDSPGTSRNSSDILALRFFGAGVLADNTLLNCAGFGVPAVTSQNTAEEQRGWSIYYVANDVDTEPALFCKYNGKSNEDDGTVNYSKFTAQAIARGVESFQVLYGINSTSSDTIANANSTQFLSANQITALDSGIPASELNKKTHWKKITAIKVAMLIRGAENSRLDPSATTYHLFGEDYSNSMGEVDAGTQINESDIPFNQRKRLRKVVGMTIQLRNALD